MFPTPHASSVELDSDSPLAHLAPPPLVADLRGHGAPQVVLTTGGRILVLRAPPPHIKHARDRHFLQARVLHEAVLAPEAGSRVPDAARPVAWTVFRDPYAPRDAARPAQVLLVVAADGSVVCFDHALKRRWRRPMFPDGIPEHVQVAEAAITATLRCDPRGADAAGRHGKKTKHGHKHTHRNTHKHTQTHTETHTHKHTHTHTDTHTNTSPADSFSIQRDDDV